MSAFALTTFRFEQETCIQQAQPKLKLDVLPTSSALDVMTDLAVVKAETVGPKVTLQLAEGTMIHRGVRSLFVTSNYPCVDGLITAADLLGDKPLQVTSQRNLKYNELCVEDVMTPLSGLDVLDYDELKDALVENVVLTFERLKCSHLLVVQRARSEGPARIRGVISSTQLQRQLQK